MINLKEFVGLDVKFDEKNYRLIFGNGFKPIEPAARTIEQMKEVLVDKDISQPKDIYFMYRDVHRLQDEEIIRKNKLRFDITVIKPDKLGRELMKTAGHYHPKSFPELYEVVYGEALCLQQRLDEKDHRKIKEVIVVKASQGQKIICLPYFGHILINPGDKPLITSNWVSAEFSSEYELYKEAAGAAYYAFDDKGIVSWQKNNFFSEIPKITFLTLSDNIAQFGLKTGVPMYSLIGSLEKIDFLNHPDKYNYKDAFRKI